jgi:hypothetical protein
MSEFTLEFFRFFLGTLGYTMIGVDDYVMVIPDIIYFHPPISRLYGYPPLKRDIIHPGIQFPGFVVFRMTFKIKTPMD